MQEIIVILLGSITPAFESTNTLLYPIKKEQKIIIALYVFLVYLLLGSKIGQWITPICVGGILLLVALFNKKRALLNIYSASLGYLFAVVLNHCFTVTLSFFDLTIADIATRYAIPFNLSFTIIACTVTYFAGKFFKRTWKEKDIKLTYDLKFLIVMQTVFFLVVTLTFIIYGEKIGYSPEFVALSGILFLIFFVNTTFLDFVLINKTENIRISEEKINEFENEQLKSMVKMQEQLKELQELSNHLKTTKK